MKTKSSLSAFFNDPWTVSTLLVILGVLLLALSTASSYGESWDEDIRYSEGERKLSYYQELFSGNVEEAKAIGQRRDKYPGFHDLNLAILRRISFLSDRITGNLFSVLFGILTIIGTARLARVAGNKRTAFLAVILLTTLPAFYGHIFINPKDIPFACGYVWSLYMITSWLRGDGIPSWKITLLTGIAIGIAMATRIGGLVLYCYLGLFVLIFHSLLIISREDPTSGNPFASLKKLALRIGGAGIISMGILLVYWPYGQMGPFTRTGETLGAISSFSWNMPVFFEGNFYNASDLPFYYILKMLFFKVPVLTLVFFFSGSAIVLHALRVKRSETGAVPLKYALILFSVIFPIGYVIFRDSILYNGIRHLLFILPPACIIAAMAIDRLFSFLKEKRQRLLLPVGAGIAAGMMLTVLNMIRLHPYQYIYYNELAGGTAKASGSFETDYWCTVYKELGKEFIHYLRTEKPAFSKPEVVVNMEHVTWLLDPFIPKDTRLPIRIQRSSPENDDYYISSTSWAADQFYHGNPIIEVSRAGIPLGVIKDRRGLSEAARKPVFQDD